MNALAQITVITLSNLRTLPRRLGPSLVIVVGMAGVVGVAVSIFAIALGFNRVMASTGRPDRFIILDTSSAATTETYSVLSREAVSAIMDAPGIARDDAGKPIASAEVARMIRFDAPTGARTTALLRGVGPANALLRPELRLVSGRMFQPGRREVIAGVALMGRLGINIGSRIHLRDGELTVVGSFESGGDSHESELIGDTDTVLSVLRVNVLQSVTAHIVSAGDLAAFKSALQANPRLTVAVVNEIDYYRERSAKFGGQLYAVGWAVGSIMAFGALFGALNTMYAAVAARLREIATLRAIGFRTSAIVASLFLEAVLLALGGGTIGAILAASAFNGRTMSTLATGDLSDSQLSFAVTVTPGLLALAVLLAAALGMLGAAFPAIRAARLPIATALKAR